MEIFAEFLANIENEQHRARTEEVLKWVKEKYPNLSSGIQMEPADVHRSRYIHH